jgi:hypothetical protein
MAGNPTQPKSPARLGNSPWTGPRGVVALSPSPAESRIPPNAALYPAAEALPWSVAKPTDGQTEVPHQHGDETVHRTPTITIRALPTLATRWAIRSRERDGVR